MCVRQAATGSSSSSRMHRQHGVPEPLDVRLAEHLRGPALVRARDDGPVVQLLVRLAHRLGDELAHPRAADALAGKVGEQIRLRLAADRDDRGVLVAERPRPGEQPRRRPGQDVVGGVLDQRPADVRVDVAQVDVAGAGAVRGARDGAGERSVLEVCAEISTSWPGWTFAPT